MSFTVFSTVTQAWLDRCGNDDNASMDRMLEHVEGIFYPEEKHEALKVVASRVAELIPENPIYDFVAADLLIQASSIEVEVLFGEEKLAETYVICGRGQWLNDDTADRMELFLLKDMKLKEPSDIRYIGAKMLHDRYYLRDKQGRLVEDSRLFFFRVACGIASDAEHAERLVAILTNFDCLPGTPTLYNAGTLHSQMSSCYLLDAPEDSLEGIYDQYKNIARLSKFAGGVATSWTKVRSRGAHIAGTNGKSNGITPWLKTLDSSVLAVTQGGRRKGACCVYLEPWHADVYEFLELKDNAGDESRRTHNLNIANWIPDLFMKRVLGGGDWTLFNPADVPKLHDTHGEDFNQLYELYESQGKGVKTVAARDLYARMMRTLAETGNGWMTFKDTANAACAQVTKENNWVVHSSNLCTEILEVTNNGNTAVCNLASINLANFVGPEGVLESRLENVVANMVEALDNVIDRNYYPTKEAKRSNSMWRPVGLGVMGLQDAFFKQGLSFDSPEAKELSTKLQSKIYEFAVTRSAELAWDKGSFEAFEASKYAAGWTHPNSYGAAPNMDLEGTIMGNGLRNSLLVAIAPTASISSLAGVYSSIEPQVSNLYKRENLSGEFVVINQYLVKELMSRGLWTPRIRKAIADAGGSVQAISEIPDDVRALYKTAWELGNKVTIDMAAARQPYIDQSQSLNLFVESPDLDTLSSMYMYAWQNKLKTTYYLRSRAASTIRAAGAQKTFTDEEALACSLENPESCEACQ